MISTPAELLHQQVCKIQSICSAGGGGDKHTRCREPAQPALFPDVQIHLILGVGGGVGGGGMISTPAEAL